MAGLRGFEIVQKVEELTYIKIVANLSIAHHYFSIGKKCVFSSYGSNNAGLHVNCHHHPIFSSFHIILTEHKLLRDIVTTKKKNPPLLDCA